MDREIAAAYLENLYSGIYDTDIQSHIYFKNPNRKAVEKIISNYSNINNLVWSEVTNKDWNENWRPFFKNLNIDNKVLVIPSWGSDIQDENKIILKIEPGMAFGTGHHETTSMMISALLKYYDDGASILDVGTGSGILAILAQKLGAGRINAIDNDADIKNNFIDNMKLNNVSTKLNIMDCLKREDFNYDIVLANINFPVLEQFVLKFSSTNNLLILSGILISDIDKIKKHINHRNFELIEVIKQNEWACLIAKT
jgi:ribosomal protein L11 methyltransferase